MNRRTVLAALGTLTTAGCVEGGTGGDPGTETGTPTETPPSETPTDDPATATPRDSRERFGEYPCPSFEGADRTVCWHTGDHESADVYLAVSTPVSTGEPLAFTLHNESGGPFGHNPYEWAIKRESGEGWEHVAPDAYVEPWERVPDGETFTWRLRVAGKSETETEGDGERALTLSEDLDDGVYAFQVTGALEGEESTRIECIALFEVRRA